MTKLQKLITLLSAVGLVVIFGCSTFQNAITPCYIDEDAATYAGEPLKEMLPYTTLFDARRINAKIDYVYDNKTLEYTYLKSVMALNIQAAEEFKQQVFSPEGPIGLLLPTLFGGVLGSILISKPADKKKIQELEVRLNGGTK